MKLIPPLHPEGHKFVLAFAVIAVFLYWIWAPLGWVGLILTLWCAYFFRDPVRSVPDGENLIIAPADGRISHIVECKGPKELGLEDKTYTRVSIFMNVFNVHVNRTPITGEIEKTAYVKGKFLNAELDKASEHNERQLILVEGDNGLNLPVVQIAGLVARRIVCFVKEGDDLKKGERFGLIRFGSRVDVYLPKDIKPMVSLWQTTIAGETILADLNRKDGITGKTDI